MKWSHLGCLGLVVSRRSASGQSRARTEPSAQIVRRTDRSGNVVRFEPSSPQLERIHVARSPPRCCRSMSSRRLARSSRYRHALARWRCQLTGRVRQVTVTLGDHVRSGSDLMTVETPESSALESALRQAHADVITGRPPWQKPRPTRVGCAICSPIARLRRRTSSRPKPRVRE